MSTHRELEIAARLLAELDGTTWNECTSSQRFEYAAKARQNLTGTVVFPLWVKPVSYCTSETQSRLVHTPHGTVKKELRMPGVKYFWVCRNMDGDKVYPGISVQYADQPCGPECVNR